MEWGYFQSILKENRALPWFFLCLMAICLALSIIYTVRSLITIKTIAVDYPEEHHSSLTKNREDYTLLLQSHWFGLDSATQAEYTTTRLPLTLEGIFLSTDAKQARALLKGSEGAAKSYTAGDTLPGSAILKQILADKVIIEYNGTLQTLPLSLPGLNFSTPASSLFGASHD